MIQYKNEDIFKDSNNWHILLHGCNCWNKMGAGIAREIRTRYPEAYKADCRTIAGDRRKLGTYTACSSNDKIIINAYTQFNYNSRTNDDLFEYDHFRTILISVVNKIKGLNYPVLAMPKIGAGLAKGDWNKIEKIIEEECKDIHVTIYYL